jgi:hypothetical protein
VSNSGGKQTFVANVAVFLDWENKKSKKVKKQENELFALLQPPQQKPLFPCGE